MRGEQGPVPRAFAIEGEAGAGMADLDRPVGAVAPAERRRQRCRRPTPVPIGWRERILGEEMENVGQQQFLMLLLMLAAEFDQGRSAGVERRQPIDDRGIDMRAIGADLVQARPGQQPPARAGVARPFRFVIAVEQIAVVRIERPIARQIAQHEGFEEPTGVRQMPFGGRGIVHRLDGRIGIAERRGQGQAQRTHAIERGPLFGAGRLGLNRHRSLL